MNSVLFIGTLTLEEVKPWLGKSCSSLLRAMQSIGETRSSGEGNTVAGLTATRIVMTDMDSGISQGQDTMSSPAVNTEAGSAPVSSDERVFRQSELNEIIGRVKAEAVESTRRKMSESQSSHNAAQTQKAHSPEDSESYFRKVAAEEATRLRDHWVSEAQSKAESDQAQRIVQNFWSKLDAGKAKYEDFDAVAGDIEFSRFPNVVQMLADHIDNSHDVLYELGKDRLKMAQLEQLSYMSPKDALVQVRRMAESIKANESSGRARRPNEPLSQLRPSNVGTDNGALSVSDYRRKYKA